MVCALSRAVCKYTPKAANYFRNSHDNPITMLTNAHLGCRYQPTKNQMNQPTNETTFQRWRNAVCDAVNPRYNRWRSLPCRLWRCHCATVSLELLISSRGVWLRRSQQVAVCGPVPGPGAGAASPREITALDELIVTSEPLAYCSVTRRTGSLPDHIAIRSLKPSLPRGRS